MVKDGVVLMYIKDGEVYPVALTEEQHELLQALVKVFEPIQIINQSQGTALSLKQGGINNV